MKPVNERLVNSNYKPGLQALNEQASPAQEEKPAVTESVTHPGTRGGAAGKLKQKYIFQLCKEMEKHAAVLKAERMTRKEAAVYLSTVLGYTVTANHVETAQEATGITWDSRTKKGLGAKTSKGVKSSRILSSAVLDLYKKLGETPPKEFTQWVNEVHNPGWSRDGSGYTDKKE